jgi:hypothetical protein
MVWYGIRTIAVPLFEHYTYQNKNTASHSGDWVLFCIFAKLVGALWGPRDNNDPYH